MNELSRIGGLALCMLVGCTDGKEPGATSGSGLVATSTSTSTTVDSARPRSSGREVAATSAIAPASSSSISSAVPPALSLTKAEFCARAVEIGEANMEKCLPFEKANIPALEGVKPFGTIAKECAMRVDSANVEYHGDAAYRCIEAAKLRGGRTTFYAFDKVPACAEVLTGKSGAGKPALFAEECGPGLAIFKNRCASPGVASAPCGAYPGGLLAKPEDHPRCATGLSCFMTRYSADGNPAEYACLPPQPEGARCKLELDSCVPGSSCYQGKCRAQATEGGECMTDAHCAGTTTCERKGGAFGRCVARAVVVEECGAQKSP